MIVATPAIHTTAGSHFHDGVVEYPFGVTADQQYQFGIPLSSLPRFFKETVENDTAQHTDANAADSWIELQKVTA